jgi:hypothetical protein
MKKLQSFQLQFTTANNKNNNNNNKNNNKTAKIKDSFLKVYGYVGMSK